MTTLSRKRDNRQWPAKWESHKHSATFTQSNILINKIITRMAFCSVESSSWYSKAFNDGNCGIFMAHENTYSIVKKRKKESSVLRPSSSFSTQSNISNYERNALLCFNVAPKGLNLVAAIVRLMRTKGPNYVNKKNFSSFSRLFRFLS